MAVTSSHSGMPDSRMPVPSLKLLVIIGRLDRGGTENHLLKILPRLRDRGVHVSVYVIRRGGVLEAEFVKHGVPVRGMSSKLPGVIRLIASVFVLSYLYLKSRPDIIHFFCRMLI